MPKKRSAKGQFVAKRATKATKIDRPKRRRARRNPDTASSPSSILAPVANPPSMNELAEFVLPGFAGYAATRMLARIVATQAVKRYPNAGKHLAVGSTLLSFLAAWMLLHRIKRLAHYQMPATVGAGIAAAQSVVQAYFPKWGWMVSDIQSEQSKLPAGSAQSILTSSATGRSVETLFPGGPEIVDDGEEEEDVLVTAGLGSLGGGGGDEEDLLSGMN